MKNINKLVLVILLVLTFFISSCELTQESPLFRMREFIQQIGPPGEYCDTCSCASDPECLSCPKCQGGGGGGGSFGWYWGSSCSATYPGYCADEPEQGHKQAYCENWGDDGEGNPNYRDDCGPGQLCYMNSNGCAWYNERPNYHCFCLNDGLCVTEAGENADNSPDDCGGQNPVCGDDMINQETEGCDGSDLGGETCMSLDSRYCGGDLSCYGPGDLTPCTFDTRRCEPCPSECVDEDGDGFDGTGDICDEDAPDYDCDDQDENIYPGAPEVCGDGIDQDCDGEDLVADDLDEDGYYGGECEGYLGGDCNDNNPLINPAAMEICDNVDQDCDGVSGEDEEGCGWVPPDRMEYPTMDQEMHDISSVQNYVRWRGHWSGLDCHGWDQQCGHIVYGEDFSEHPFSSRALAFDGDGDYIGFGDVLNSVTLPFSVETWVFIDAEAQDRPYTILTSDDSDETYYGFWLQLSHGDSGPANQVGIHFGDGAGDGPNHRQSKRSDSVVELSDWTHVAAVVRGAEDMDIYIDGEPAGGTYSGNGGAMQHSNANFKIGVNSIYGARYFDGKLDDIRVWNKALTQEGIQQSMEVELTGNEDDLVAYWKLNEGSGIAVTDDSENNNRGVLEGNPAWTGGNPVLYDVRVPWDCPDNTNWVKIYRKVKPTSCYGDRCWEFKEWEIDDCNRDVHPLGCGWKLVTQYKTDMNDGGIKWLPFFPWDVDEARIDVLDVYHDGYCNGYQENCFRWYYNAGCCLSRDYYDWMKEHAGWSDADFGCIHVPNAPEPDCGDCCCD